MVNIEALSEGDNVLIKKGVSGIFGDAKISFDWDQEGKVISVNKKYAFVDLTNNHRTIRYNIGDPKKYKNE